MDNIPNSAGPVNAPDTIDGKQNPGASELEEGDASVDVEGDGGSSFIKKAVYRTLNFVIPLAMALGVFHAGCNFGAVNQPSAAGIPSYGSNSGINDSIYQKEVRAKRKKARRKAARRAGTWKSGKMLSSEHQRKVMRARGNSYARILRKRIRKSSLKDISTEGILQEDLLYFGKSYSVAEDLLVDYLTSGILITLEDLLPNPSKLIQGFKDKVSETTKSTEGSGKSEETVTTVSDQLAKTGDELANHDGNDDSESYEAAETLPAEADLDSKDPAFAENNKPDKTWPKLAVDLMIDALTKSYLRMNEIYPLLKAAYIGHFSKLPDTGKLQGSSRRQDDFGVSGEPSLILGLTIDDIFIAGGQALINQLMWDFVIDKVSASNELERESCGGQDRYKVSRTKRDFFMRGGNFKLTVPKVIDKFKDKPNKQPFPLPFIPAMARTDKSLKDVIGMMWADGLSLPSIRKILYRLYSSCFDSIKDLPSVSTIGRIGNEFCRKAREMLRDRDFSGKKFKSVILDASYEVAKDEEKAVCFMVAIGVTDTGSKMVLAVVKSDGAEGTSSWASFLELLKDKGLNSPDLFTGDGSKGLKAALDVVFPKSRFQLCCVHKSRDIVRNLPEKTDRKTIKAITAHFKKIYLAPNAVAAREEFDSFKSRFAHAFPKSVKTVEANLDSLLECFNFPQFARIYLRTSNSIESLFSGVKSRTARLRGCCSPDNLLSLFCTLVLEIEENFKPIPMTAPGAPTLAIKSSARDCQPSDIQGASEIPQQNPYGNEPDDHPCTVGIPCLSASAFNPQYHDTAPGPTPSTHRTLSAEAADNSSHDASTGIASIERQNPCTNLNALDSKHRYVKMRRSPKPGKNKWGRRFRGLKEPIHIPAD
jgi:transposase-like protein